MSAARTLLMLRARSSERATLKLKPNRCSGTWRWSSQLGGAKLEHLVKWNVYIVEGQSLLPGFQAFQRAWGDRPNPPAVTVAVVAGLAHLDYLVEIEATAVVPAE